MKKQKSARAMRMVSVVVALVLVVSMVMMSACAPSEPPESGQPAPVPEPVSIELIAPALSAIDMSNPDADEYVIEVSWTLGENEAILTALNLEFSTDSKVWQEIDGINAASFDFAHLDLMPNSVYSYRLTATYGNEGDVVSNTARAITKREPLAIITITKQPTGGNVYLGSTEPLILTAEVDIEGIELEYQWYISPISEDEGFVPIVEEDGTDSTYTVKSTLELGSYWYYCKVTAERAEPIVSDTIQINVIKRPAAPVAPPADGVAPSPGDGGGGAPAPPSGDRAIWKAVATVSYAYGTLTVHAQVWESTGQILDRSTSYAVSSPPIQNAEQDAAARAALAAAGWSGISVQ